MPNDTPRRPSILVQGDVTIDRHYIIDNRHLELNETDSSFSASRVNTRSDPGGAAMLEALVRMHLERTESARAAAEEARKGKPGPKPPGNGTPGAALPEV